MELARQETGQSLAKKRTPCQTGMRVEVRQEANGAAITQLIVRVIVPAANAIGP